MSDQSKTGTGEESAPATGPQIEFEDEAKPEVIPPEAEAVEGGGDAAVVTLPEATEGGAPAWAAIPKGLKFPRGRNYLFFRFKASWTDTPHKGMEIPGEEGLWRQCVCWAISPVDKRLGYERCQGDQMRVVEELAKTMVRAVDGHVASWTGMPGPANMEVWWNELGERCRQRIINAYLKLHALDPDEMKFFFENCVAVRSGA